MAEHVRLGPAGLFDSRPLGFHQVQASSGARIVHMAGQAALDRAFQPLAVGDFAGQLAIALGNIDLCLEEAGAARSDIAMLRLYVVGHDPAQTPAIVEQLIAFFGHDRTPPATLVGVERLAMPELLVEIEAVAIA
jgi:enamine deaminase RidA (YjgF/YER057c/UK114 family)